MNHGCIKSVTPTHSNSVNDWIGHGSKSAFSLKMSNHYTKMAGTVREKKEPLAMRFAICTIVIYVSR